MNYLPTSLASYAHDRAERGTYLHVNAAASSETGSIELDEAQPLKFNVGDLDAIRRSLSVLSGSVKGDRLLNEAMRKCLFGASEATNTTMRFSIPQFEFLDGAIPNREHVLLSQGDGVYLLLSASQATQSVNSIPGHARELHAFIRSSLANSSESEANYRAARLREISMENYDALDESAAEFGIAAPGAAAKGYARSLLLRLCEKYPAYYRVYPFSEGRITINASLRRGHSFLIVVKPSGNVSCFLTVNGKKSQAHYDSIEALPDGYFRDALGPKYNMGAPS